MTIPTNSTSDNLVQDLRKIRDDFSSEIKDMTFEEERAYLDKLLSTNLNPAPNTGFAQAGQTNVGHGHLEF